LLRAIKDTGSNESVPKAEASCITHSSIKVSPDLLEIEPREGGGLAGNFYKL